MEPKNYLNYIVEEIHSTVAATVDEAGRPVTCAIDMMYSDGGSLYFLTAKGKHLYHRLKAREDIAFTGIKGQDTLSCIAVSVQGKAKEVGSGMLPLLFEKNPYMAQIYPTLLSRNALTVFKIYEGTGEWFDLSKRPIERAAFSFGGIKERDKGYYVTQCCIGCRKCLTVCPQMCIRFSGNRAVISQEHCLHCGNCLESCPEKAIKQR